MIETHITNLLETLFEKEGYKDCYLVDMKHNQTNNKVEVFVDTDTGIDFGRCQKISRYLEGHIDEEGWLGEKYVLEVSSPGVSRPLKLRRQYPKNIGRKMEVKTKTGEKKEGLLTTVKEDHITLEEKVRVKEGKKKVNKVLEHHLPFSEIEKAVVKISFKK